MERAGNDYPLVHLFDEPQFNTQDGYIGFMLDFFRRLRSEDASAARGRSPGSRPSRSAALVAQLDREVDRPRPTCCAPRTVSRSREPAAAVVVRDRAAGFKPSLSRT